MTLVSCKKCGNTVNVEESELFNYERICNECSSADKDFYVIYNQSEAIWCYKTEAYEKMANGWTLYAVTYNEGLADILAEEACYV